MLHAVKGIVQGNTVIIEIEKDEENPSYFESMKKLFSYCFNNKINLVTSTITIEEYLVYPYKKNRYDYIESFERLLEVLNFEIINIDKKIAYKAAKITNCNLFITNDKQLCQFSDLNCITVDKISV